MATAPRTQQAQFLQRRLARRAGASDLTRLAQDFSRQIGDLSGQFETEFSRYQDMVNQTMAPFQEQLTQYQQVAMPAYESALSEFQGKYDSYLEQLRAIEADPVTVRTERVAVGRTWYGRTRYGTATFFDPKPIPTFDEKAPDRPEVPIAPEIAEFDTSPFEQRKAQLQEGFQRETAERRSARLSAVRRRDRTMLSGAQ